MCTGPRAARPAISYHPPLPLRSCTRLSGRRYATSCGERAWQDCTEAWRPWRWEQGEESLVGGAVQASSCGREDAGAAASVWPLCLPAATSPAVAYLHAAQQPLLLCFPQPLSAAPPTPSTLLLTKLPSSCTEATQRGTSRWPPPLQVNQRGNGVSTDRRPRRPAVRRCRAGLRWLRWLGSCCCHAGNRSVDRSTHRTFVPTPTCRCHRHHCERRLHDPLGRDQAAHAGGCCRAHWHARQIFWAAHDVQSPSSPCSWPPPARVPPPPARPTPHAPSSPPAGRCGTRPTALCCTAPARRGARRGCRPSTRVTGQRWVKQSSGAHTGVE